MTDFYDRNESRLRVAHKYLVTTDRLYRTCRFVVPTGLSIAILSGAIALIWSPVLPLPPAAVPKPAAAPASSATSPSPQPTVTPPASAPTPGSPASPSQDQNGPKLSAKDRVISGVEAFEAADYPKALELLWPERNNPLFPEAAYHLGAMYHRGYGVAQDYALAMDLFRHAAESGYPKAYFQIGVLYANGRGVSKSTTDAMSWYRKAADRGEGIAAYNLGLGYLTGDGVPKDAHQGLFWMLVTAQQLSDPKIVDAAQTNIRIAESRLGTDEIGSIRREVALWKPAGRSQEGKAQSSPQTTLLCGQPVYYSIDQTGRNTGFLGVWIGNWNSSDRLCGGLIVQKVEPNDAPLGIGSHAAADVIYIYGPSRPGSRVSWKQQHPAAYVSDNVISFQDEQGSNFDFYFYDSDTLDGRFSSGSGQLKGMFQKAH